MSDHAKFSPSKMERIITCPGSMVLEAGIVDKPSKYAAEGSVAHELAQIVLTERLAGIEKLSPAACYIGRMFEHDGFTFTVDEDMADHVQAYVDAIEQMTGPLKGRQDDVLVEQRVYHHRYAGCAKEEGFGTSDLIFLDYPAKTIRIRDLKYGMGVRVFAEGNQQGMTYALGVLDRFSLVEDWEKVEISIHQPRLDHLDRWECGVDELMSFADELREAVERVQEAESIALQHEVNGTGLEAFLQPSDKGCKFCKAKAVCPALRATVVQAVTGSAELTDFDDLGENLPVPGSAHSIDYLGRSMDLVPLVETWCLAVRAEIERRLFAGEPVDSPSGGYGLDEGKRGNREWQDKAAAEAAMKAMRLRHEDMFNYSLISPTVAEKKLKENPKRWATLAAMVTQKPGRPTIKPRAAIKSPIQISAVADDFDDVSDATPGSHPFR